MSHGSHELLVLSGCWVPNSNFGPVRPRSDLLPRAAGDRGGELVVEAGLCIHPSEKFGGRSSATTVLSVSWGSERLLCPGPAQHGLDGCARLVGVLFGDTADTSVLRATGMFCTQSS
jgi:hypothetical protein